MSPIAENATVGAGATLGAIATVGAVATVGAIATVGAGATVGAVSTVGAGATLIMSQHSILPNLSKGTTRPLLFCYSTLLKYPIPAIDHMAKHG